MIFTGLRSFPAIQRTARRRPGDSDQPDADHGDSDRPDSDAWARPARGAPAERGAHSARRGAPCLSPPSGRPAIGPLDQLVKWLQVDLLGGAPGGALQPLPVLPRRPRAPGRPSGQGARGGAHPLSQYEFKQYEFKLSQGA